MITQNASCVPCKYSNSEYYRSHFPKMPKLCSNIPMRKSPSPFCHAANVSLISLTASATCGLLSLRETVDFLTKLAYIIREELLLE